MKTPISSWLKLASLRNVSDPPIIIPRPINPISVIEANKTLIGAVWLDSFRSRKSAPQRLQ
jgi:hypothetical protein